MSKSKIVLASIGGATLVAALVLAYFIWSAFSEKDERSDELEGAVSEAIRLVSGQIYPGQEAVDALQGNAATYNAWRDEAMAIASMGDETVESMTPPACKTFIVEEARRLSVLPGGVDGVIVRPEFPFGFDEYVNKNDLPKQEEIAKLCREWRDMALVVRELSNSGVIEIVDIKRMDSAATQAQPGEAQAKGGRGTKQRQQKAKKAAKADERADSDGPAVTRLKIDFRTMPPGLVASINALMATKRFIVIDGLTFEREEDEIDNRLKGGKKPVEQKTSGRAGRGGRAAETVEAEVQTGVVTDPVTAPPLRVGMTLSVYDFRSKESGAAGEEEK